MHNNIMAAGSRDRPPMLATGRYAQWRSRFLRYIDTRPNGDALRKCILKGPYTPTIVTTPAVPATENSPAVPEQTTVETVMNMTPENRAHFESEKEAIHLILTGIGDEIYSTVDACQTAQEMWEAIERLQQGESLNIQDVKTNLFWEFGQFTSHDGETIESYYTRFYKMMNEMIRNNLTVATMQVNVQFLQQLQPEWSRFVTIVKQQHKLDEVSYHKLFDILKQYQKEVNELRAERMAKNANPLALVATAQTLQDPYYQTSKPHKSYAPTSKASLPTRSHATTRYKGKEIAKPITPPSESASEEDSDPEQAQRDKDMQKNLALIAKYFKKIYKPTNNNLRTSSNTRNKNVDTTPRYKNDNQTGQFGNQRAVNVAGAKETVAVMSADSAVTYTSVHSEARSWSIPSEDPYEEAAQQLFEQAPRSPEYVPENHIPVYIPEPEHPEDLVPAEDEAPIPPLPPSFLAPRIRPLSPRALEVEMRDVASAYYHSLHPSGTPSLLPIPPPAPSTSRRADIPEADTPPRKRLLLTTPRPGCEIGESSAAAAARQPGPTIETRLLDTERRMMTALELVNRRITYQVDVCSGSEFGVSSRHHYAQRDRADVRGAGD
ncbi:hypothetical protein Tco_0223792 [Tanacetum coccineum]